MEQTQTNVSDEIGRRIEEKEGENVIQRKSSIENDSSGEEKCLGQMVNISHRVLEEDGKGDKDEELDEGVEEE